MTGTEAAGLPLTVWLAGCRVLVVGAGPVAAAKTRTLLAARAAVDVVAPAAVDAVAAASDAGALTWQRRRFRPADVDGAFLVVAATADTSVNDAVARAAAARATLCVRVDGEPATAAFAAAVRRGPLMLTVSTDGAAPALARRVREELDERYDDAYGELADLLGALRADADVRAALAAAAPEERAARWRRASSPDILAHIRAGQHQRAKEVARTCLLSSSD